MIVLMTMMWRLSITSIRIMHFYRMSNFVPSRVTGLRALLSRRSTFDITCSTFDIHEAPPLITFQSHFDGQFCRLKL